MNIHQLFSLLGEENSNSISGRAKGMKEIVKAPARPGAKYRSSQITPNTSTNDVISIARRLPLLCLIHLSTGLGPVGRQRRHHA